MSGSHRRTLRHLRKGVDEINVSELNQVIIVDDQTDLPPPQGGEHQLEDGVAYEFQGEVESDAAIRIGNKTPLLGRHRETDWFIYTGGSGAAIRGTDKDYVQSDMSINAPGGDILNLDGAADGEFLIDSSFFADDQGIGDISSLGSITGYRSPEFNQVGIRDFQDGLTIGGTVGRVNIDDVVMRDITEPGVTMLEFDSTFTAENVSISNCFVTDVQSDTVIVNVDGSATINEIFRYIGNSHDGTVTKPNILTGAAGVDVVGYSVTDSFPIADSTAVGEISADSLGNTITIGSQNSWVEIDDFATSEGADSERLEQSSDGTLQYIGKSDKKMEASCNMTLVTGGDTVSITISINGVRQDTSLQETQSAAGVPIPVTVSAIDTLETDDEVEVQIRNDDSASDITCRTFNLNVTPA